MDCLDQILIKDWDLDCNKIEEMMKFTVHNNNDSNDIMVLFF